MTFIAENQFDYAIIACFLGFCWGVAYTALRGATYKIKNRIITGALDAVICVFGCAVWLFGSFLCRLPVFRAYLIAFYLVGFALYVKSFNKIVAIIVKKVYNHIVKKYRKG